MTIVFRVNPRLEKGELLKERWYLTVMVTDDGHIAQIFAVLRSAESGLNGYMTVKRLHQRQGQSIIVA
ncbi:MAG: hypothetical protein H6995_00180 [Pseudomonadales bacterium]|nr:hypothetical protein [Pseudomonadales bacterium]